MAAQHRDVAQVQTLTIAFGQGHGLQHPVNRRDFPGRALTGQCQGNRAAAGAQVQDPGWCRRQQRQRGLHQQLGVGTRDQGMGCDFQVEFPETLLPEDVRHRLAGTTSPQVFGEQQRCLAGHDPLGPGVQEAAGFAQGCGQQQLGVQPGRGRIR
ncbi:hypothetical protein D3C78_1568220 [compost metagenome]